MAAIARSDHRRDWVLKTTLSYDPAPTDPVAPKQAEVGQSDQFDAKLTYYQAGQLMLEINPILNRIKDLTQRSESLRGYL